MPHALLILFFPFFDPLIVYMVFSEFYFPGQTHSHYGICVRHEKWMIKFRVYSPSSSTLDIWHPTVYQQNERSGWHVPSHHRKVTEQI